MPENYDDIKHYVRCADSGGRYGKIGFYGEITEVSAIAFSFQIC